MRRLTFAGDEPLRVLALGAHSDDIEIGCGGSLMRLAGDGRLALVTWVVMSAEGIRASEARAGAAEVLAGAPQNEIRLFSFRDGYFPAYYEPIKDVIEGLAILEPDLVLVPRRDDAHQDHRMLGELAGTVFRDHTILEYEIPKSDPDMGQPNLYVELSASLAQRKIEVLLRTFPSQQRRAWFTPDTFHGLMRLRGVEARAASGFAEAFLARKLVL